MPKTPSFSFLFSVFFFANIILFAVVLYYSINEFNDGKLQFVEFFISFSIRFNLLILSCGFASHKRARVRLYKCAYVYDMCECVCECELFSCWAENTLFSLSQLNTQAWLRFVSYLKTGTSHRTNEE